MAVVPKTVALLTCLALAVFVDASSDDLVTDSELKELSSSKPVNSSALSASGFGEGNSKKASSDPAWGFSLVKERKEQAIREAEAKENRLRLLAERKRMAALEEAKKKAEKAAEERKKRVVEETAKAVREEAKKLKEKEAEEAEKARIAAAQKEARKNQVIANRDWLMLTASPTAVNPNPTKPPSAPKTPEDEPVAPPKLPPQPPGLPQVTLGPQARAAPGGYHKALRAVATAAAAVTRTAPPPALRGPDASERALAKEARELAQKQAAAARRQQGAATGSGTGGTGGETDWEPKVAPKQKTKLDHSDWGAPPKLTERGSATEYGYKVAAKVQQQTGQSVALN